jgi:hypothetical protein
MSDLVLRRIGGRYQPIITTGRQLQAIPALDPAHWGASVAPVWSLCCDPKFLELLDADGDGHILPADLVEAIEWWSRRMASDLGLNEESDRLQLGGLSESEEGRRLLDVSVQLLENLGLEGRESLGLEELRSRQRLLQIATSNGDGIIPPGAVGGEEARTLARLVLQATGGALDRNGEKGIGEEHLERFLSETDSLKDWEKRSPPTRFGIGAEKALAAAEGLSEQLDGFFTACIAGGAELMVPLSVPGDPVLESTSWIRPEWRTHWRAFCTDVLEPIGTDRMDWREWESIWRELSDYSRWKQERPPMDCIAGEELWNAAADSASAGELRKLMAVDRQAEAALAEVGELEKLVLLQRGLKGLSNTFVSFSRFYDPARVSPIEAGALLMDGRWMHLCLLSGEPGKHRDRARESGFFLLYSKVDAPEPYHIVSAVTRGNHRDWYIGKSGYFVAADGTISIAEVVDIVQNPISIPEAMMQPIHFIQGMVRSRLDQVVSMKQEEVNKAAEEVLGKEGRAKEWLVGGSLAAAALGSSLAYLLKTVASIPLPTLCSILLTPLLLWMLLSGLRAGWKIRRRDLAPLLEASGWGINHPLPVPAWADSVFTREPELPEGAQRLPKDLLREYHRSIDPWRAWRLALMVALWGAFIFMAWQAVELGGSLEAALKE